MDVLKENKQVKEEIIEFIMDISVEDCQLSDDIDEVNLTFTLEHPTPILYLEAKSGQVPNLIKDIIIDAYYNATHEKMDWEDIKEYFDYMELATIFINLYDHDFNPIDIPDYDSRL